MAFSTWITRIFAKPKKSIIRKTIPLFLYSLEDRITPTSFTVTNTDDSGTGSLRQAILNANTDSGNDQITFDFTTGTSPFTITLQSSLPAIANAGTLTITGQGDSSSLIINGNNGDESRNFNIFNIDAGSMLNISGVTVSGALSSGGGGAFRNAGTLNVSNSTITGNSAITGGGIYSSGTLTFTNSFLIGNGATTDNPTNFSGGGGLFNDKGIVTVTNSTLLGNSAFNNGGGIYTRQGTVTVNKSTLSGNLAFRGGGIYNLEGTNTVTNSTLYENSATGRGGGIYTSFNSTLTVTNSTISGNNSTSAGGGGIFNSGATLNIANCILANNIANISNQADYSNDGDGAVILISPASKANNLVTQNELTSPWATTVTSAQLNLGPLQNNGGPTSTCALLPGSVAIGAGNPTISNGPPVNGLDQRGLGRVTSDIGAFAFDSLIQVTTTADTVNPGDGLTSLREAITVGNTNPGNDQIIFAFATGTSPFTITLQSALPAVTNNTGTLSITGLGASSLTISGNNGNENRDFNIFTIGTGGDLTISGVTVSGAQTTGNGGAFNNSGTLNVSNSTLSGNTATSSFGGGIFNSGTLAVSNSTLSGNSANGGGAIYNSGIGTVTVSNSTLSGNEALGGGNNNNGGGIYNKNGNLTVSNSTLSGNFVNNNGGGIYNNNGTVTVSNSTLSGNFVNNSGGGIYNNNGTVTVSNSTLSSNKAIFGGGIYINSGTANVINSTLSGNSATNSGGGIYNASTLNIANTIIANSTKGGDFSGPGSVNLINPASNANNLVTLGSFAWATTVTSAQLNLGPLQNNGGQTSTFALLPGSAAINAGNTPIINATPINGLDQRGFTRFTSDIGAFAFGVVIQVNTTADTVNPGDGQTSLREAITMANDSLGPDQITFAFATGTSPYTITLESALPAIATAGSLTITGLGASSLTISGNNGNTSRNFNIFNIDPGSDLTISGVTLSGAQTNGGGGAFNNSGTLNLSNSTLSGNTATSSLGGGILNSGTAIISNSTLSGNSTNYQGAAIFNSGALTVTNSTLSGNEALGGGGIFNNGTLTASNTTLSSNKASIGGGINNSGTLAVSNSSVTGNSATSGGGIYNSSGTITVTNSTLSGNSGANSSGGSGGGITINNGTVTVINSTLSGNTAFIGGCINNGGTLTVSNSTLSGNSATNGGGIYNSSGTVTVINSTLSGNTAFIGGCINNGGTLTVSNSTLYGNYANYRGGGIFNPGTVTVTNSTISNNNAGSNGGGIYNFSGTLNIANSILANTLTGGDFSGDGSGTVNLIPPASNANNLVSQGSFKWATTVTNTQLNLGPLQNNGGPTSTMALLPGSVAIGAGNATVSNASPVNAVDQRGFARSSTTPSIGAFEFYNAPTVNSVSPASGTTAGSTPITITGNNFVAGPTTVTIGGVAATNAVVVNSTTITANTPAGTSGSASVLVTTAGGNNAANTLFTYYAPAPLVTGTTGGSPQGSTLNFVDPSTGITNTVVPFPGFMGDVRVAAGDINGDGKMETIAAAGTGGGPAVNILDSTGKSITAFFAYDPAFRGGLYISVSDVNNDGFADIVTGAGAGGGPHVKIFNGKNLQEMGSFFAFDEGFTGGVSVASADINGDGTLDIVTGAGPGGGPHVKVFDGKSNSLISQWFAYSTDFRGGVFVAMGDIGNNGQFEVVTGPGPGGGPLVAVFNPTGVLQTQFLAYSDAFLGGVRVGVSDGNGDGVLDLVTGAGPGGAPHVKGFNYPQLDLLFEFFSGPETNRDGVNVS